MIGAFTNNFDLKLIHHMFPFSLAKGRSTEYLGTEDESELPGSIVVCRRSCVKFQK